jgi:serine/threonine protein kinase
MGNEPGSEQQAAPVAAPAAPHSAQQAALDADVARIQNMSDTERLELLGGQAVDDYKDHLTLDNPKNFYIFKDVLGKGHFGQVHQVQKKDTREPFACKEIDTGHKDVTDKMLQNEMATMMTIKHPHLIRITDAYKHQNKLYIMMPLVPRTYPGQEPDLMTWLVNGDRVTEKDAATIVHHTAVAIKYLNENLLSMHRDLKPENILVGPDGIDKLLVTDFGMARMGIASEDGLQEGTFAAGTPGYTAPELLDTSKRVNGKINYGHEPYKVDVFSLGVVLYSAMVKYPPFGSNEAARRGNYTMNATDWRHVSTGCKNLVRKMMEHDQSKRYSIEQVLADPWLKAQGF